MSPTRRANVAANSDIAMALLASDASLDAKKTNALVS